MHCFAEISEFEVDDWWSCVEVTLKGGFLTAHATLPHLVTSKGSIILVSSSVAQRRFVGSSPYNTAKHALNRLAEWIDIDECIIGPLSPCMSPTFTSSAEYRDQGVRSFAVHPGAVATNMNTKVLAFMPDIEQYMTETPELSAWSYVRLTSGSEDWLSGRFVDVTAGLDELGKLKEKIIEQDALKNRLALPI